MKKQHFVFLIMAFIGILANTSCISPVTLTSWKNKEDHSKISKVVIMGLFGKLEYTKPLEQSVAAYFNSQGLKSLEALDFLNPTRKYEEAEINAKLDSLGADAILVFTYKGTEIEKNYVPDSYYGYWGRPWGWGYGPWGGYLTSGGYWMTTRVVNLKASLYTTSAKRASGALWTSDITVTEPQYIDRAATNIAKQIYADWQKYQILK